MDNIPEKEELKQTEDLVSQEAADNCIMEEIGQPDAGASEELPKCSSEEEPNPERELTEEQESTAEAQSTEEASGNVPETPPCPLESELRPELDELKASAGKISAQLEEMTKLFNSRIMYVDHEEKIVDQMHKELQKHREGLYAQLIRPILLDIIEVRDSILRMAAAYLAKPEGSQAIPNKTFSDYSYDLQDILEKNNVEIYRSKEGDAYTPIRQRAAIKRRTADPGLHGKIAESLSCGYLYNGGTISAEKVAVYFYEEPKATEQNHDEEET